MGYFEQYFQQQASRQSYFEPIYAKQTFALGADASEPMFVLRNRPVDPGIYRITVNLPVAVPFEQFWAIQGTFDLGRDENVGKCGVWIRGQDGLFPSNYIPDFDEKLEQGYDPTTEQNVDFYRSYVIPMANDQGMVTGFYCYLFLVQQWPNPYGLTPPTDLYLDQTGRVLEEVSSSGAVITVDGALGSITLTVALIAVFASLVAVSFKMIDLAKETMKTRRIEAHAKIVAKLSPAAADKYAAAIPGMEKPDKTGKVGGLLAGLSWLPWAIGLGLLWALVRK